MVIDTLFDAGRRSGAQSPVWVPDTIAAPGTDSSAGVHERIPRPAPDNPNGTPKVLATGKTRIAGADVEYRHRCTTRIEPASHHARRNLLPARGSAASRRQARRGGILFRARTHLRPKQSPAPGRIRAAGIRERPIQR